MIRNVCSYANKALIAVLFLLAAQLAEAQKSKAPDYYKSFLNTQFWLGLRFGINYTDPISKESYTAFSSINDIDETYGKTYNVFDKPGGQAGLHMSLYHRGFSIELQPTFKIVRYSYFSELSWEGNTDTDNFETRYDVTSTLNMVEVPLVIKYDFIRNGEIRPFIMGGLQYSFMIDARKNVEITHTDFSSGLERSYSGGEVSLGVRDQFKNFYGAIGGAGASFDYSNIRTVVELSYLYALSSVTNADNLYQENELLALGEVNDKLHLNNINIAVSFVFPFRYIDKTFQSH